METIDDVSAESWRMGISEGMDRAAEIAMAHKDHADCRGPRGKLYCGTEIARAILAAAREER